MKNMLLFAVVLLLVALGTTMVSYAQPLYTRNDGYGMMTANGGCHSTQTDRPYEWYFLHLSQEDRDLLDLMLLDALAAHDFETLTASEQMQLIRDIKADLVEYIINEGLLPSYGR